MKAVLMSIKPLFGFKIAKKDMIWEIRKNKPTLSPPFKVYFYCTKQKERFAVSAGNYVFTDNLYLDGNVLTYGTDFKQLLTPTVQFNGKVIGEFVCDRIEEWDSEYWNDNSVYQAISRIDYDDEGDYEWVNISSNEDDNPSDNYLCKESCLSFEEIQRYAGNGRFYAWHISDLVIYDKPKELSEFFKEGDCEGGLKCKTCTYSEKGNEAAGLEDDCIAPFDTTKRIPITRPPQSWCYVEEID